MDLNSIITGIVFPLVTGVILMIVQSLGNSGKKSNSQATENQSKPQNDQVLALQAEIQNLEQQVKSLRTQPATNNIVDESPTIVERRIAEKEHELEAIKEDVYQESTFDEVPAWRRNTKNIILIAYIVWVLFTLFFNFYNFMDTSLGGVYLLLDAGWVQALFIIYILAYNSLSIWYLWGTVKRPNIIFAMVAYMISIGIYAYPFFRMSRLTSTDQMEILSTLIVPSGVLLLITFFTPVVAGIIYTFGQPE